MKHKKFLLITSILIVSLSNNFFPQNKNILKPKKNIVISDSFGNNYVAGNFKKKALEFGNIVLNNYGKSDIFVAKYDSHSKIIWAKNIGGSNDEKVNSLEVDAQGNCYITGSSFSKKIITSNSELNTESNGVIFGTEINSLGNVVASNVEKNLINKNLLQKTFNANGDTSIQIISPSFGQSLKVGTKAEIKWKAENIEYVIIELSLDNGASWQNININENDFSYNWVVPDTASNECLIRISDYDNEDIADTSELFSTYGKLRWDIQETNYNSVLQDLSFSALNTVWAAGYDGLIETTNEGESWTNYLKGYALFS
ncbi:MAG: hypothetical protein ABI550_09410 [Ignavibacteriaceae bacterium]